MDPTQITRSEEYYDLGTHSRQIRTGSPDAQLWFNRGLLWSYTFNHEEAVRCFERATVCDPYCAMPWWGIAYALGPNYNKAWSRFDRLDLEQTIPKAKAALSRALQLARDSAPVEHALCDALSARFPSHEIPDDLAPLDHAYANAMRSVYESYSDDLDVVALFAEALVCTRARDLWDLDTGKPTSNSTLEARALLESAMAKEDGKDHPAFCHMYIHLMEMSPFPELALPAANTLRHLVSDGSHLMHMATHIDIACGDYYRAMHSNHDAMVADNRYFSNNEPSSVFYIMYRAHNVYAKIYAAIMLGHQAEALSTAKHLWSILTPEVLSVSTPPMADWAESYLGALAHVLVRFGRWNDILQLELPSDHKLFCSTTAMLLYARGIALGVLGRIDEAEEALVQFEAARAAVPVTRLNSLPSKEVDVLRIASAMLKGELEYRKGNYNLAFSSLRRAVQLEDSLPYTDTPPWMQPVRHALGALLLEQNYVAEAEVVYREDLGLSDTLPRRRGRLNNVWGLHGLYECFVRSGKAYESLLTRTRRDAALLKADVPITASCYCRLSTASDDDSCCRASG
ncbi:hypothetical protein BDV36DRAFT_306667 [Aspergillus pseudocaelatus]|uniref:TPR domain protein n=1 Tax=Aspergillus pseudocaelatus TaxID=1825620 RepID=A0ABQ6WVE4_9EURO|nr:hypothetical protein BDV36DRAFT_306667 [Aspergillus pseudocaelatus]